MLPKISIIIPCYNHGMYIKDAIESVELCKDKELYEIIIMNDGSTDKFTVEILQELAESGYHVINQQNQGLGAARNNAIKQAAGKYILPLDSDNKIRPDYIYESIKILDKQPDIAMVYGDSEYFGEKKGINKVGEFNLQRLMLGNFIDACAVYRKSVWEKIDGYDEKMPVMGYEDWDLWLKMALNGFTFRYLNCVMFDYRVRNDSMLHSIDNAKGNEIREYMNGKYQKSLGYSFINDLFIKDFKKNKKLLLKLMIAIFLPRTLNWLEKKNLIASKNVFM